MTRFGWSDYLIFFVYLTASALVGLWFGREQHSIRDYFLAGRSMKPLVVAVSVLAALFSGVTYLGAPSEVYANGIAFLLIGLSFFVATPVANLIFLPFFYRSGIYTAYQYLEERFSVQARMLSAGLFILRVLFWLSLATYAPALALEQVTGLPLWITILITGVVTTVYTSFGGMKAVIWTDVMQFFVLFGGQIAILCLAVSQVSGGASGVYEISRAGGKLALNTSLDPTVRVTLWGLVIGGAFYNLIQMATDQVSVQRYLTATSLRAAQRSLWIKLAFLLPVIAVFYVTGLALYAFYQIHGDPLKAGQITKQDQILPYFVITQLPAGMPGLLIAAIYAASMSTISAGINALTSITLIDFYQRLRRNVASGDVHNLELARYLTIAYGVLVMLLAFLVGKLGTLVEVGNGVIGLMGGPMVGLFLLGLLSRRANALGAVIGWIVGLVVLLPIYFATKISFLWYAMIGCLVTMFVGWSLSLLSSAPAPSQVEGLTWTHSGAKDVPVGASSKVADPD
jgi:sodium-coupled monocarboxylate transporter 8/12